MQFNHKQLAMFVKTLAKLNTCTENHVLSCQNCVSLLTVLWIHLWQSTNLSTVCVRWDHYNKYTFWASRGLYYTDIMIVSV